MPDFDPESIFEVLERHGVRYVVIGALAAIAQGYPLNTNDLDVTPASDPDNLERLATALTEMGARLQVAREPAGMEFAIEPDFLRRAESWTLTTRFGDFDLCFMPAGTRGFDDLRRSAIAVRIRGIDVQMADILDVIRMKEAAGRPKDLAQLPALRQTVEVARRRERRDQS